jgi:hypothetical protein
MPDLSESDADQVPGHELDAPVLEGCADEDDEWDDENNDVLYLKYCFEGAASIAGLSTSLRLLADDLDRRAAEGWSLISPVDGGYAHLTRAPVAEKQ